MKCRFLTTKIKILAFFGLCCGFCSLFVSPSSYALDDLVIPFDSTSSFPISVCSGASCSSYSYFYYTCSSPSYSTYITSGITFTSPSGSLSSTYRSYPIISPYFSLPSGFSFYSFSINTTSFLNNSTCTLTLSENPPSGSCPECEVCQICPVIPENPYDDKFDQIIRAIYVCAGTLLVLYFFYCIYRLIIKNSGVH